MTHPLWKYLQKNLHGQTVRAKELKFWEKIYLHTPVTCHCHMSEVMCHMSCVLFFLYFFWRGGGEQSGDTYWWRVCYQQGLNQIVFFYLTFLCITNSQFFWYLCLVHVNFNFLSCIQWYMGVASRFIRPGKRGFYATRVEQWLPKEWTVEILALSY